MKGNQVGRRNEFCFRFLWKHRHKHFYGFLWDKLVHSEDIPPKQKQKQKNCNHTDPSCRACTKCNNTTRNTKHKTHKHKPDSATQYKGYHLLINMSLWKKIYRKNIKRTKTKNSRTYSKNTIKWKKRYLSSCSRFYGDEKVYLLGNNVRS